MSKAASSESASIAAAHFYARYSRSAQCSKLLVKLLQCYFSLGNPPLLFVFKFEFSNFHSRKRPARISNGLMKNKFCIGSNMFIK